MKQKNRRYPNIPFIYKITNDLNDKVYIGKTNFTLEKRWAEHLRDFQKDTEDHRPIYSAMRKYGVEHFQMELVEEVSSENTVLEREKYWIEYYNSFQKGYNATRGGDGKTLLDYPQIIATYQREQNCEKVAKCFGVSVEQVRKIIHISNETVYQGGRRRAVKMCDLNKNVLQTFESSHAAARYLISIGHSTAANEGGISSHILEVCKGKRKTCYQYIWEFV